MQKKLLSLAIASALAIPGAAMADVSTGSGANITVYGQMHASWDYVDNDSHGDDNDDNTAVFRNSRIGFKGSEDLGGGLKGIWNIEARIDTGANDVRLRDTFVGLSSDRWGTIKMGRHNTPYKMATEKLDGFADTIADFNNIIGVHMTNTRIDVDGDGAAGINVDVNGDGINDIDRDDRAAAVMNFNERENQLLMYETPNFNGFSAAIARESFTVDEERMEDASTAAAGTDTYNDDDEWETLSFMAKYDQGPYFASFAYEEYSGSSRTAAGVITSNHGATDEEEVDAWKIGLGYTFGNSKLAFVYEDIDVDDDDQIDNEILAREAYWGMFSHRFGNNVVKLAYGRAEDSDTDTDEDNDGSKNDDDEADNWSIGVEHEFSKRTKVYAIYSHMDNDSDANYGLYQGQNGAWSQDGIANGGGSQDGQGGGFYRSSDDIGEDVSAFSVGIIHTF